MQSIISVLLAVAMAMAMKMLGATIGSCQTNANNSDTNIPRYVWNMWMVAGQVEMVRTTLYFNCASMHFLVNDQSMNVFHFIMMFLGRIPPPIAQ